MATTLLDKIRRCPALPSLPAVALRVVELSQSDHADAAAMSDTISQDPALASKLLRTVNSSFYGCSHKIGSLKHAVAILGFQSVRTLVLGFSLAQGLSKEQSEGFDHRRYWRRSLHAAAAARVLAGRGAFPQTEECMLAAMLMDIGMLAMHAVLGPSYGSICASVTTHDELEAAERAALGTTHSQAAGALAELWQFPPVLAVPMAKHHHPEVIEDEVMRGLVEIAHLAGRCADVFVDPPLLAARAIADVRDAAARATGATAADCDAVLTVIEENTRELARVFDLSLLEGPVSYEQILRRAEEAVKAQEQSNSADIKPQATATPAMQELSIIPEAPGTGAELPAIRVRVEEMGGRSIRFRHAGVVAPGGRFHVRTRARNGEPVDLLYTAVSCEPAAEGEYSVGVELTRASRAEAPTPEPSAA